MELSLAKKATPMRLKDFLVDELSSCSSNGFRTYPRQCFTTKIRLKNPKLKTPKKSSVFQRASNALFNAVKLHLHRPFAASVLHKKLIKRCFSNSKKRIEKVEIPEKTGNSPELSFTTTGESSWMSSDGSNSWSGSDFTASDQEYLQCSRGKDEVKKLKKKYTGGSVINKGIVGGDQDCVEAISDASSSTSPSNKPLRTEEEKEQLSPVCVLDCPFEDDQDDDEVSSTFQPRLARSKGSKKRLVKKAQKLEGASKVEPMNLEKCIALSECEDLELRTPSPLYASPPTHYSSPNESKEINDDEKAFELLQLMRSRLPSSPMNAKDEKVLLEFFREGMSEMRGVKNVAFDDDELLSYAVNWMKGQPQEVVLRKEDVKKKMEACLVDIEKEADWRKWDEGKKELVLELEAEVLASLLEEMLL